MHFCFWSKNHLILLEVNLNEKYNVWFLSLLEAILQGTFLKHIDAISLKQTLCLNFFSCRFVSGFLLTGWFTAKQYLRISASFWIIYLFSSALPEDFQKHCTKVHTNLDFQYKWCNVFVLVSRKQDSKILLKLHQIVINRHCRH